MLRIFFFCHNRESLCVCALCYFDVFMLESLNPNPEIPQRDPKPSNLIYTPNTPETRNPKLWYDPA